MIFGTSKARESSGLLEGSFLAALFFAHSILVYGGIKMSLEAPSDFLLKKYCPHKNVETAVYNGR